MRGKYETITGRIWPSSWQEEEQEEQEQEQEQEEEEESANTTKFHTMAAGPMLKKKVWIFCLCVLGASK
jgi:hypothetical protein